MSDRLGCDGALQERACSRTRRLVNQHGSLASKLLRGMLEEKAGGCDAGKGRTPLMASDVRRLTLPQKRHDLVAAALKDDVPFPAGKHVVVHGVVVVAEQSADPVFV